MRPSPAFKTADDNFAYLVKKLHHGSWDTNPVRHDFHTFVCRYPSMFEPATKQPLVKFLASKAKALQTASDSVAVERLRAHVRRYFARELKWKRPEWLTLVETLSGPRTAPSITYVFKRGGAFDETKLAKLSVTEQKQFLVAGGKYLGGNFRALAAFFKKLRADPDEEGIAIQRWQIRRKGDRAPVYEMWTFMVDNGTVFAAGTSTPVVEMTQGTFHAPKRNADLAADLQGVVPF